MSAIIQVDVIIDGQETAHLCGRGKTTSGSMKRPTPSPTQTTYILFPGISGCRKPNGMRFSRPTILPRSNVATFRFRIQQTDGAQDENPDNNSFELEVPFRFFLPGGRRKRWRRKTFPRRGCRDGRGDGSQAARLGGHPRRAEQRRAALPS